MKRWHEEEHIARRNWQNHRRHHVDRNKKARIGYAPNLTPPYADPYVIGCDCDEQIGRYRKTDAWDCHQSQCWVCHGDKFPKRDPTRQERLSEIRHKEQIQ